MAVLSVDDLSESGAVGFVADVRCLVSVELRVGVLGRGDELGADVEEPPMSNGPGDFRIPGYTPAPVAFSRPPAEDVELSGEVPWELRDEPPSEQIFN